jgi:predicted GIY-YIG superfamily endonuclease
MADMDLLYDAARIGAEIRAMYLRVKEHPLARYFVYVLALQHGKLYVGSTDNIYCRLSDHFECSPRSAVWVREYGPPVRVVEICKNCTLEDEQYKFAEYADKFGFENVRGGGCCRLLMHCEPLSVRNFARRIPDTVQYLSRSEIDDILVKVKTLTR